MPVIQQNVTYACDRCGKVIPEGEDMEVVAFLKTTMNEPKRIILCELHSKELEVIMRKWWKGMLNSSTT